MPCPARLFPERHPGKRGSVVGFPLVPGRNWSRRVVTECGHMGKRPLLMPQPFSWKQSPPAPGSLKRMELKAYTPAASFPAAVPQEPPRSQPGLAPDTHRCGCTSLGGEGQQDPHVHPGLSVDGTPTAQEQLAAGRPADPEPGGTEGQARPIGSHSEFQECPSARPHFPALPG